jgi:hypothetical protein
VFEDGFGNKELEGLREIRLPEPVSYAPQTIGWWIVFALLLLIALYVAFRLWRRWRRNAYRRRALAHLAAMERDGAPALLPRLLKRTALDAWPREEVANLSGDAWLAFLDRVYGGVGFTSGPGRVLPALAYGEPRVDDAPALFSLARTWIRTHRA